MTDIPRLRAGGVGGQFWSVYVPVSLQGEAAIRAVLEQIEWCTAWLRATQIPSSWRAPPTTSNASSRRAGSRPWWGWKGATTIDNSLGTLRMLHALGAAYMTLTHSDNVPWADASTDTPRLGGLSKFGEEVVLEMNRLGMLVDLSHVSAGTMADALRVSRAPVIFSHSSARAICDHPRNVPDEILSRLKANGGVAMVTFVPSFIAPEEAAATRCSLRRCSASGRRIRRIRSGSRLPCRPVKAHPDPPATLAMVADHIDHMRQVAGIDHIGIGSDFDGIQSTPAGLEDVSKYPH